MFGLPAAMPVAVTLTVELDCAPNVAAWQLTCCANTVHEPMAQLAAVACRALPRSMVRLTPLASRVARFSSVALIVVLLPSLIDAPDGVLTTRSTAGATVSSSASRLFPGRSSTSADTVALIIPWPSVAGVVEISTVRLLIPGTSPIAQLTVPAPLVQTPADALTESSVRLGGNVKSAVTLVASMVPLFVTS